MIACAVAVGSSEQSEVSCHGHVTQAIAMTESIHLRIFELQIVKPVFSRTYRSEVEKSFRNVDKNPKLNASLGVDDKVHTLMTCTGVRVSCTSTGLMTDLDE